ncbi:patatin-like phospholipase family protein [Burkholderia sp. LMU1-1-1.1]|uniref:patatin-like phospholipase family protein n=1 Tax=Burkholderia sp. LMU1-1-1.1 TaxID=3135266 RepID=UPI003417ADF4
MPFPTEPSFDFFSPGPPVKGTPVPVASVLEYELMLLHGVRLQPSADDAQRELRFRAAVHALPAGDERTAICLSGGGVRSATFCLGVLQALAERKWLDKFHYMSSVSGGGYIASWLSSWISRSKGDVGTVLDHLAPARTGAAPLNEKPEPEQVRQLRAYSNYMSPVHGFSIDLITLIATFIRNLTLHWLMLLPLLAALVMLPRLNLAMTFRSGPWLSSYNAGLGFLVVMMGLLLWGLKETLTSLPSFAPQAGKEDTFMKRCFIPMCCAAIAQSWAIPRVATPDFFTTNMFWIAVCAGAVVTTAAQLLALRPQVNTPDAKAGKKMLAACGAGAIAGALMFCVIKKFAQLALMEHYAPNDMLAAGLYSVFFVPALLAAGWLTITIYVGLAQRFSDEDDREWWARASAWIFWACLLWIFSNAVVIFGPYLLLQSPWTKLLGASAGGMGVVTGLYGYWSKHGQRLTRKVKSAFAIAGERVLELAAAIFITALLIVTSFVLAMIDDLQHLKLNAIFANTRLCAHLDTYYAIQTTQAGLEGQFLVFAGLVAIGLIASRYFGTNTFSLHSMYGNRLVRAYLGAARDARSPNPFTGFDPDDNLQMDALDPLKVQPSPPPPPPRPRLYHVINIALNLVKPSNEELAWQQRKAASFTVTPHFAGSKGTQYQRSDFYSSSEGISLARAMTISGAAASSSMGYHTSTLIAFVMTFFNVRLGWWLPNPGLKDVKALQRSEPPWGSMSIMTESLGATTAKSDFVYLSDGGHFENLGLYEMVRRRCRRIVVVDASCDPKYEFEDLENAIRKIRIDFGISIVFPDGLPTPAWTRGEQNKHKHSAHGVIRYSTVDGPCTDGSIIYIKPLLSGNEPLDITRYAAKADKAQLNPFPHHSTADQFFDEVQFESYRALGYHSVMADFPQGEAWKIFPAGAVDASEEKLAAAERSADNPEGGGPSLSGAAGAVRAAGQAGLLWTTIAATGALGAGVVGTLALRDGEVALKKGGEVAISKESLDELRKIFQPREADPAVAAHIAGLTLQLQNLRQSIVDNSSVNNKISNDIGQLINKQINLINHLNNTRNEQTLTDIKSTLQTISGKLPAGTDYSDAIKAILAQLVILDKTLQTETAKITAEIHKTNSRAHVRGGDGVRP